jgi:DNA polymerase-1
MSVLDKLSLENHNLLIDADLYLFQATVASEETICWDEDGDIWSLRADLKQAKKSFTERLESFKRRLDGGEVLLCFTTGSNFRKTVYEPYKSNRKKTRKPVGYVHMVAWAMEHWPSITVDTLEADDIMGILQSAPGYETVVVSDDKDLLGIPGTVYRPMKDEIIDVSLPEADAWFLKQCLMGDSTDGYKGCPGMGPKTAEKVLGNHPSWEQVAQAYIKAGLTREDALVQSRCARILRWDDWDQDKQQLKLWEPPNAS